MTSTSSTTTTAIVAKRDPPSHQSQTPASGCGGDGCGEPDAWPLHYVRHRGAIIRLCTSCVLKYNPGSFCPVCFDPFEGVPHATGSVVQCSGCPSISHTACLADPGQASRYLCPTCANPNGFSYFPAGVKRAKLSDCGEGQRGGLIDRDSAKVLLAASRVAFASMSKAAAFLRAEAERKVKESLLAKKKAREALEAAICSYKKECELKNGIPQPALTHSSPGQDPLSNAKKMAPTKKPGTGVSTAPKPVGAASASMKTGNAVSTVLAAQKREREKLMKFHDPMPTLKNPPTIGGFVNRVPPYIHNHIGREENISGKSRVFLAPQISLTMEDSQTEKESVKAEMAHQMPPSVQDASAAKGAPKVRISG